jgi:3-hydroxyisobutyrate dehydrogenase-like beta-hydroxyacid dehydrogenase
MAIHTVAILSTGDMGHAVGNVLRNGGLRVITSLSGRGARTAALAARAGIEDVGSDETLVRDADVVLSILPPAHARDLALRVAKATRTTDAHVLFVDCNAVAPATACEIGTIVAAAGGRFVDAGIIGGPPRPGELTTRFYASGNHAEEFAALRRFGLDVRVLSDEVGHASGLKMCYAALTKGFTALATELLVAANALGLTEPLMAEFRQSQATLLGVIERQMPGMPPKAYRWVGEMEEIAATFGSLGLTPKILEGAAELYRFVEHTPLGADVPESRQHGRTLDGIVALLTEALGAAVAGGAP